MKYKLILTLLLSAFLLQIDAQNTTDIIKTNEGDITIHPITHGTLVITFNNKTIYVDPYGGAEGFKGYDKPDIILITDIHGDHLNLETLEGLDIKNTLFITPHAVDLLTVCFRLINFLFPTQSSLADDGLVSIARETLFFLFLVKNRTAISRPVKRHDNIYS